METYFESCLPRTFQTMTRHLQRMSTIELVILIVSLVTVVIPSIRHSCVAAANSTETLRLLQDVVDSFDNRVRPIVNQTKPIDVYVTYNLVNLVQIDEVNQRISLSLWVNFSWWDEVRTWDPDDYGGNEVIHPNPRDIWRPKTVLTNSADERDVFKDIDSPLSIYYSGATRLYVGGIYYFICSMDLTYFPFDEQTCSADVMATNLGPEINFIPSTHILLNSYIVHGEWDLKSTQVKAQMFPAAVDENLAFLVVTLTFQRLPTFYLLNVLLPTMCLSFLSLFGFIVPKDSGERASFAITVLLALAVYMGTISGQLPANSDTFPLISIYIFSLICLSMLSVLIIVCQLRLLGSINIPEDQEGYGDGFDYRNDSFENGKMNGSQIIKSIQVKENMEGVSNAIESNNNNRNDDDNRTKNAWDQPLPDHSKTLKSNWKVFILKYDDIILMSIFAFLWAVFSITFISMIAADP